MFQNIKIHYSWFLLIINPVLCLIGNLISIIRGKRPSYFSSLISIVIILSYFPLLWDVRSNFYRVFYFPEDGLNFYTSIISFLSDNIGLPFIAVILLYSVIIVTIYVTLLKDDLFEIQKNRSLPNFLITLLLFSFLFEYRELFDLQKTTLSIAFFILSIETKNFIFKNIFLILSVLFHPLMIMLPIFGIISSKFIISYKVHIIIFVISLILGTTMPTYVIDFVSNYFEFSPSIVNYLLMNESKFSSENIEFIIRLLKILSSISIFIVFFHFLKTTANYQLKKYSNLILLIASLSVLMSFNDIALERLYLALSILVIFVSIKFRINLKYLSIIYVLIAVNILIHGVHTLHVIFSNSYEVFVNPSPKLDIFLRVFYYPTFFLLDFGDFGQSNEYINTYTNI